MNFGKNKEGEEVKPFKEPPETLEGYTQVHLVSHHIKKNFKKVDSDVYGFCTKGTVSFS